MTKRDWPRIVTNGDKAEIPDKLIEVVFKDKTPSFAREDIHDFARAVWQRMITAYNATRHLTDEELEALKQ